MAVRARPGIRTARLAGGLAVAGALLLAAPATALAQEATPPAPAPATTAPLQVAPAPIPSPTRASEPAPAAPPTVQTRRPSAPLPTAPGQPPQVSRVPQGAPETGGGATASGTDAAPFVLGGVALLGAAGAVAAVGVRRRRGSSQG